MTSTQLISEIDQEIRRREKLLVSFPLVIAEKIKSMGLTEESLKIEIQKRNGIIINITEEKKY